MAIYKGDEVKFGINLTANGFDMDANDFDVEIVSPRAIIRGNKGNTDPTSRVRVFKEEPESGSESDSPDAETAGGWFVIAETDALSAGSMLKVVARAYIPDANAIDGVRTEIAVCNLDNLVNPY